jgi:hypothetical protein
MQKSLVVRAFGATLYCAMHKVCHCDERSDVAIQKNNHCNYWIAALPLVARNDERTDETYILEQRPRAQDCHL